MAPVDGAPLQDIDRQQGTERHLGADVDIPRHYIGFTLVLDAAYATDTQMDTIAAVSDELMLGSSNGRAFVAVDREADTLDIALRSAITDIETALPEIRVLRVEVDRSDLDAPTAA